MGTNYPPPPPAPNSQPPKKSNTGKYVGLGCLGVIGLFVVLALIGSLLPDSPRRSSGGSEEAKAREAPPRPKPKLPSRSDFFDADDLVEQYEANEVAADSSFKGNRVLVTGQINRIGKDILNTPYVTLGSGPVFHFQAMFDKDDEPELAQLKQGQRVWLACKVTGKMMNVLGDDCRLQETQD